MSENELIHPVDLAADEMEFLILVTIMELESLSIKNIIKLLDSSKGTIYRKITDLIDKELIEIDPKKTARKPGKYYKVTKKTLAVFQNDLEPDNPADKKLHENMKEKPLEVAKNLANGMRSLNTLHLSLINIFKESALGNPDHVIEQVQKGYFATSLMGLELKSEEDKEEVKKLVREFMVKLEKYTKSSMGLTDNSYPLYISMFPLSRKQVFKLLDEK